MPVSDDSLLFAISDSKQLEDISFTYARSGTAAKVAFIPLNEYHSPFKTDKKHFKQVSKVFASWWKFIQFPLFPVILSFSHLLTKSIQIKNWLVSLNKRDLGSESLFTVVGNQKKLKPEVLVRS